jgi:hypothetical protein
MSDAATTELPDLDEYHSMSLVEIGQAFVYWPEGSEDQARALAAFLRRAERPGIGHNRPPLAEALEAETEGWRRRSAEIHAAYADTRILDNDGGDSARKVSDIAAKAKDLEDELDAARLERTKPYRAATKLTNDTYGELIEPLKRAGLAMRQMLTAHDNKVRAAADAEKRRLEAEQRQREAEAAEAQRKADEAARAGAAGQVNRELEAARSREAADQARLRAEAVRPTPIRSHLGQVQRRRETKWHIADLDKAVGWLLGQDGYRKLLEDEVKTIIGAYLKSLGVDVVARGVVIPGVEIAVELGTAGVRR